MDIGVQKRTKGSREVQRCAEVYLVVQRSTKGYRGVQRCAEVNIGVKS